jgi:hypothetical protein
MAQASGITSREISKNATLTGVVPRGCVTIDDFFDNQIKLLKASYRSNATSKNFAITRGCVTLEEFGETAIQRAHKFCDKYGIM